MLSSGSKSFTSTGVASRSRSVVSYSVRFSLRSTTRPSRRCRSSEASCNCRCNPAIAARASSSAGRGWPFGGISPRGELVEDLYPGRRHVLVAEREGQVIQSQPTLLHLGTMTCDAMRRRGTPESWDSKSSTFLREGSPNIRRQESERQGQKPRDNVSESVPEESVPEESVPEESVPEGAGPGERGASAPCPLSEGFRSQGAPSPARPFGIDSQSFPEPPDGGGRHVATGASPWTRGVPPFREAPEGRQRPCGSEDFCRPSGARRTVAVLSFQGSGP